MDIIDTYERDFTTKFNENKDRYEAIEAAAIYYDEFTEARLKYLAAPDEDLYVEFLAIYNAAIEGLDYIYEKTQEPYVLDTRNRIAVEYEETPAPDEPVEPPPVPGPDEPGVDPIPGPDEPGVEPIPGPDEPGVEPIPGDDKEWWEQLWDEFMALDDAVKVVIVGAIIIAFLWMLKQIFM